MGKARDLVGQRFGHLLVLHLSGGTKHGRVWRVRCDCGAEKSVLARSMVDGRTKSCGHLNFGPRERKPLAERFWALVAKGADDACWEFIGARAPKGYGMFQTENGRARRANRVAWQIANGPIPPGRWVLHRCDNPPCVNPAHLFLGVAKDNTADMLQKGRAKGPARKIPIEALEEICELRSVGVEAAVIAKRFGVTRGRIYGLTPGKHPKPSRRCLEAGCDRLASKLGMCDLHYKRAWRSRRANGVHTHP